MRKKHSNAYEVVQKNGQHGFYPKKQSPDKTHTVKYFINRRLKKNIQKSSEMKKMDA